MNAYRCDRCGEHYDGQPVARVDLRVQPVGNNILDLCGNCWGVIAPSIVGAYKGIK